MIDLKIETQSVWSDRVPVTITLTPLISSERVELRWDSYLGVDIEGDYPDFISVAQGAEQVYRAEIIPAQSGTYNLTLSALDWNYGESYQDSTDVTITFDDDLKVIPTQEGYQTMVILKYLLYAGGVVMLLGVTVYMSKFAINFLKEWLKPMDN